MAYTGQKVNLQVNIIKEYLERTLPLNVWKDKTKTVAKNPNTIWRLARHKRIVCGCEHCNEGKVGEIGPLLTGLREVLSSGVKI